MPVSSGSLQRVSDRVELGQGHHRPGAADMDLIENLQGFVAENLALLTPVDQAWQPTDFLPDLTAEDWADQVRRFRDSARQVSDELLVVLVGNMVTEEALPSYSMSLDRIVQDKTGTDETPW